MAKNETTIKAEPGKLDMYVIREFDAPRELVFKAFTDPELYKQWNGPDGYEMDVKEFEPISGGRWSFSHKDTEGNEYAFHGVYHDVTAPKRIIQTFEYDGLPEKGHACFETIKFEELPEGRTRLVGQSIFQSVEDRDGMIASGMETGINDGYNKLDALLEKAK